MTGPAMEAHSLCETESDLYNHPPPGFSETLTQCLSAALSYNSLGGRVSSSRFSTTVSRSWGENVNAALFLSELQKLKMDVAKQLL